MKSLVDSEWLAGRLSDPGVRVIEIDWEGREAYSDGHLPGAAGWNWKAALWDPLTRQFPADEDFAARLGAAGVTRDTTVVLYGVPVQFGTYAWWVFKLFGHDDVRILDGGKEKWVAEGRPVEVDEPSFTPTEYVRPERMDRIRATRDDVLAVLDDPATVILDHRSFEEYSGERVGLPGKPNVGAERSGRIPGARHVPFESLLNEDGTFRSAVEIADILRPHVTGPDTPVICYCRLAHRATLASFAITELLGFRNVRVYDGSWTEWGSMVGMPIER